MKQQHPSLQSQPYLDALPRVAVKQLKQQALSVNAHVLRLLLTSLLLLGAFILFLWQSSFAGNISAVLNGVRLSQIPAGTKVVLLADKAVKYQILESDDEHVALQIEGVAPNSRLKTQLNQSKHVHHMAIKNIGAGSVQLILHGEQLGHPYVSFDSSSFAASVPPVTVTQIQPVQGSDVIDDSALALPMIAEEAPLDVVGVDDANSAAGQVVGVDDTATTEVNTAQTAPATKTAAADRGAFDAMAPRVVSEEAETATFDLDQMIQDASEWLVNMQLKDLLGIALFGGLALLGLWLVVRTVQGSLQPMASQRAQGKGLLASLKTVFSLGRLFAPAPKQVKSPFGRSQQIPLSASQYAQQPQQQFDAPPVLPQQQVPVARQAAQGAYQRNNIPVPPTRKPHEDNELEREIKRSINMKYAIGNAQQNGTVKRTAPPSAGARPLPSEHRSAAVAPQQPPVQSPQAQRPQVPPSMSHQPQQPLATSARRQLCQDIPENQEVLSFLRNVAELMERDGKPGLANDVKRAIQEQG